MRLRISSAPTRYPDVGFQALASPEETGSGESLCEAQLPIPSGRLLQTIPPAIHTRGRFLHRPNSEVSDITSDWRVIACDDRAVWFLATPDGRHLLSFVGHDPVRPLFPHIHTQINSVVLSEDLLWALSAADDGTVRLWSAETGELLRSFFLPSALGGVRDGWMRLAGFLPPDRAFGLYQDMEKAGPVVWNINSGHLLSVKLEPLNR